MIQTLAAALFRDAPAISAVADSVTAITAVVGVGFVISQLRAQRRQARVDAQMRLYNLFDSVDQAKGRRIIFEEVTPGTVHLPKDGEEQIRRVLVSFNLMAYRVLRGLDDDEIAWTFYSRSLIKILRRCWAWLEQERRQRDDPPKLAYCRHAELLARRYAERTLQEAAIWRPEYGKAPLPELLQVAEEAASRGVYFKKNYLRRTLQRALSALANRVAPD